MAYPPLQRCILRAHTLDGYRAILAKPVGTFSLQGSIHEHHEQLTLGQQLQATESYPTLTVVDLVPATICQLTDASTFVVLPPQVEDQIQHNNNMCVADDGARSTSAGADVVEVRLASSPLAPSEAVASASFVRAFCVVDGAVMSLSCGGKRSCRFSLARLNSPAQPNESSPLEQDALTLTVGPWLFRNLRAAFLAGPSARMQPTPHHYAETHIFIPLDDFVVEESEDGELYHFPTHREVWQLTKLTLCPAVENQVLMQAYGERYADVLTAALQLCGGQLHGLFVSPGDVVALRVGAEAWLRAPAAPASVGDALEMMDAVQASLQHRVRMSSCAWLLTAPDGHLPLMIFRILDVESKGRQMGGGLVCVGTDTPMTEVNLVSQSRDVFLDATPLYPPTFPPHGPLLAVEQQLHDALSAMLSASLQGDGDVHRLVLHGAKENHPYEHLRHALERFGIPVLVASAAAMDAEVFEALMHAYAHTTGKIALVIKNAEAIVAEYPHLLPLLDGAHESQAQGRRLLVCVSEGVEAVAPALAARATNVAGVMECGMPSEDDRRVLFQRHLLAAQHHHGLHHSLLLSAEQLAGWAVGLTEADIAAFMSECAATVGTSTDMGGSQPVLSDLHCEAVLQRYLNAHGHNLVSTRLQPVRWTDVGGLEEAKRELRETIQLPLQYPELFAKGIKKRAGILFYGPPGCGKTLLAKAVATEMSMNFISVKGPELINQYVGESERNIRLLFQRARDSSPCIVFFDELDALAPARGAKGDAGGAMDRIVSQLLVEVDGVGQTRSDGSTSGSIFIIGATNRPDLLDPSLLRPGRFDRLCYLGIPSTREEQLFALRALTRKFLLSEDVDFVEVLRPLDFLYTGADLFALCSDAMMLAVEEVLDGLRASIRAVANGEEEARTTSATGGESGAPIEVRQAHFLDARSQLKASVNQEDLQRYEALKTKFAK